MSENTPEELENAEIQTGPDQATQLAPMEAKIEPADLNEELQRSYLDYAMSVIVGRALPDVRDGMKPVHRRVVYAMYDGGYRPDRGWNKCSRVVGEVMGRFHPHGDASIYDTLVRLAQKWVMRAPLVAGQGNFGSAGNDPAAAMRYTECKMAPLAMEMVRDIHEDTVDFEPNYDNKEQEPTVLPSRFPNLLVNGSSGIAVGMATNIPPHNLREVADAVQWLLANPEATKEEQLEACMERVKGPDFPTGAQIVGRKGIVDAYRTGRGSITMRAVVNIEEDKRGRTSLVATELPYMCNPDRLAERIADLVNDGKIKGISNIQDDSSSRTGQRLVIQLKRDAQPKVVLNNLYKHTDLQTTFGCNMLALVDGVPLTLKLDQFIRYWVRHQIQVIQRRTDYRRREAEKRAHLDRGLVKALNMLDETIKAIRESRDAQEATDKLKALLDIDDVQAKFILDTQLRRLTAMDIEAIRKRLEELEALIADLEDILAKPERQRQIVSTELQEIVDKYGDDRRTEIVRGEGSLEDEDLIPDEEMVVTITMGGYAKRTRIDQYRTQKRGGKGVKGANLRTDDEVEFLFTTANKDWMLFFTNFGRVYRSKVYELPEGARDAKGSHLAGLLSFQPDERIAQVLTLRTYADAKYLLLATRNGLVKKTALTAYDSPLSRGLIAINFREEDDRLIGAALCNPDDDILLISRKGQSVRFHADDEQIRPTGRATSGVTGMKFREGDELLSMSVIPAMEGEAGAAESSDAVESESSESEELSSECGLYVFTLTDGGYAKRTPIDQYRVQSRGGIGIKAMKLSEDRGHLVGGLIVTDTDEVISMKASGQIIRSSVADVAPKGRDTMGVKFVSVDDGDSVIAITLSPEEDGEEENAELVEGVEASEAETAEAETSEAE